MKSKIKNKRKGNVILMVLMVAAVLIILSAVVASSLVYTTKGNTLAKYKEDYLYAAEGGIEQGIQRFQSGGSFPFSIDYLKSDDKNPERGIESVTVDLDDSDRANVKLVSTVKSNGEEVSKIILPVGKMVGMSTILQYSLAVTDTTEIKANGSINFDTGQIGTNSGSSCEVIKSLGSPEEENVTTEVKRVTMNKPEFNSTKVPTNHVFRSIVDTDSSESIPYPFGSFEHLIKYVEKKGVNLNSNAHSNLTNGLGYYIVEADGSSPKYTIILVNSTDLTFSNINSTLTNTILVSSNNLTLNGVNVGINRGTIYAPNIFSNLSGNLHQVYAPLFRPESGWDYETQQTSTSDIFSLNGNLTKKQLNEIDNILMEYMDTFGSESSLSGKLEINYEDAEYIY